MHMHIGSFFIRANKEPFIKHVTQKGEGRCEACVTLDSFFCDRGVHKLIFAYILYERSLKSEEKIRVK